LLPRETVREGGKTLKDFALLLLRVMTGMLLAGHGAQKLFGHGGGPGIEGTAECSATVAGRVSRARRA